MRGLKAEQKNKLYEHIINNDVSFGKVSRIGSLIQSGKSLKEAIKESDKYLSVSLSIYLNKKMYAKIMEKHNSQNELIVYCINKVYPNFAIKNVSKFT
jgi:hypothetical protein